MEEKKVLTNKDVEVRCEDEFRQIRTKYGAIHLMREGETIITMEKYACKVNPKSNKIEAQKGLSLVLKTKPKPAPSLSVKDPDEEGDLKKK